MMMMMILIIVIGNLKERFQSLGDALYNFFLFFFKYMQLTYKSMS